MSKKTYDLLKELGSSWLPEGAILWAAIATYWNLPYKEAIAGSIVAVSIFLNKCLKIESDRYHEDKSNE